MGVQLGERECPAVIIRHFGHRRFGRLDGVWSVVSISLCKPTGQDARPLSLRKNEEEDFHQIPFQPAVQRRPQSEYEIFIRLAFPIFSFNSKVQEFFFSNRRLLMIFRAMGLLQAASRALLPAILELKRSLSPPSCIFIS